jgi:hypothetical protein
MQNDMVQRLCNARATGGATVGATPVQRPCNGGATLSPYPYGVAPAFEGGANAFQPVPNSPLSRSAGRNGKAGAGCQRARLSRSEVTRLVHYLKIMRCTPHLSHWERTFCGSIIRHSERGRWWPTERQAATMQRIVAAFKRATLGDGEGVIE